MKIKTGAESEELGLTKRWEAISLACLWESGVHSGLGQRRKRLTGVGGHCGAERDIKTPNESLPWHQDRSLSAELHVKHTCH